MLKKFLNVKYVYGEEKTYKGIDCSALLQIFFIIIIHFIQEIQKTR